MCPARAKSATQKRDTCEAPHVQRLTESKSPNYPVGTMLISSPLAIDAAVRRIPKGSVVSMEALRAQLARAAKADYTCPLTTGIFWRIAAEAAEEERVQGTDVIMPWWRVVRTDGSLMEKSPGGVRAQMQHLTEEGVPIRSGKWKIPRVDLSAAARDSAPGRRGTRA
jgi:hypothetical protein